VQITRYTSLNEAQFLGCASAFVDSLSGALNGAVMYLHKLQGQRKGSAFAFEIQLDQGRYGALMILDRWAEFVGAFAAHVVLPAHHREILDEAPRRVQQAAGLLEKTNHLLDASEEYSETVVAACESGFQTVELTFQQERQAAERTLALGPMLSEDFKEYRRVFLGDLAAR
jgi:hypothetical protein